MRTQITKSLQTQCKTIQNAISEYNNMAAALTPPMPPLDWTQVSNYIFIEHFTLFQGSHNNIRQRPWSLPVNREYLKLHCHIKSAETEIDCCNVEA